MEIRLRVWTGKKIIYYVHDPLIPHYYDGLGEFIQQYCACDFELYSGLNDCYGKGLYEGDIFKYGIYRALVVFKDGAFGYKAIDQFVPFANQNNLDDFLSKVEVIGNIHHNPELLEK
jgi:hypothetical protein